MDLSGLKSHEEQHDQTELTLGRPREQVGLLPIDFVVVEFPANESNFTGEMVEELLRLIETGLDAPTTHHVGATVPAAQRGESVRSGPNKVPRHPRRGRHDDDDERLSSDDLTDRGSPCPMR